MNVDATIKVLLLDVGGVIVPPADPDALARVARRLALSAAEVGALFYEWEPWYALSTGRLEEDAYWRALGKRVGWDVADLRRLSAPPPSGSGCASRPSAACCCPPSDAWRVASGAMACSHVRYCWRHGTRAA